MAKVETIEADDFSVLADLVRRVGEQTDRTASLATLVGGLADQIRATSNDQNIQRLARALRGAAPGLIASIDAKDIRPAP